MDKRWLDLRWPITVLLLGAMGFVLLARSSKHPIQLRLQVNFDNPLAVGGTMQDATRAADAATGAGPDDRNRTDSAQDEPSQTDPG